MGCERGNMEAIILPRRKRGEREEQKKKTLRVAAMKAREASVSFSTLPLIEACRCF